jgi:hypothetical protein
LSTISRTCWGVPTRMSLFLALVTAV